MRHLFLSASELPYSPNYKLADARVTQAMKTQHITAIVFALLLPIVSTSGQAPTEGADSPSVQAVKGGVLEFDKSITLGQAFDGYRHFTAKLWTPATAANGRKTVEAAGTINFAKLTPKDYAAATAAMTGVPAELLGGNAEIQGEGAAAVRNIQKAFKGAQIVFQFVLNLDDTFELKGGKVNLVLADNRVAPVPMSEEEAFAALKDIYEGRLPAHVMGILLMSGIGASSTTTPQPSTPFQQRGPSLLSPSQGGLQPSGGLK